MESKSAPHFPRVGTNKFTGRRLRHRFFAQKAPTKAPAPPSPISNTLSIPFHLRVLDTRPASSQSIRTTRRFQISLNTSSTHPITHRHGFRDGQLCALEHQWLNRPRLWLHVSICFSQLKDRLSADQNTCSQSAACIVHPGVCDGLEHFHYVQKIPSKLDVDESTPPTYSFVGPRLVGHRAKKQLPLLKALVMDRDATVRQAPQAIFACHLGRRSLGHWHHHKRWYDLSGRADAQKKTPKVSYLWNLLIFTHS